MSKEAYVEYETVIENTSNTISSIFDRAVEYILEDVVLARCPYCGNPLGVGELAREICGRGCQRTVKVVVEDE